MSDQEPDAIFNFSDPGGDPELLAKHDSTPDLMAGPSLDHLSHKMLEVSEIFTSIQGEGPFMGRPASFLRLSRCVPPLCPWCDSMHASGPGKLISIKEVAARISSFKNNLCVITGGEPFLQWDSGLNHLEACLIEKGFTVQYETSGKILIPAESKGFKVCSPKYLANIWHYIPENDKLADCFKFVVKDDLKSVETFVKKHNLSEKSVWIMPMGAHRDEQLALSPLIWEFCVENHFNFSSRLHTLIFNNRTGV